MELQAIFAKAVLLSEPQRSEFLDEVCADNEKLRNEVEAMLRLHFIRDSESSHPEVGATATPRSPDPLALTIPHNAMPSPADRKLPWKSVQYIGDYDLIEEIARGGMGIVFKAKQRSLGRIVAVKVILQGVLATEKSARRFRTEAEAAGNLDHPCIVPIYEVGEHEGLQYYSMKYVEGQSLAAQLKHRLPEFRDAAQLIQKLSQAIHHAHQRGVLHRDLKPSNILIDESGHPMVTDFGLAKIVETDGDTTRSGELVGTPNYMSPEQARSDKSYTAGVDVYGLGAILYELLTGKPPFSGLSFAQTLKNILETTPTSPRNLNSRIPAELETICMKCLEKQSSVRYISAAELAEDLQSWLDYRPIRARRTPMLQRALKWTQRHPTWSVSLAMLCLACIAIWWTTSVSRLRSAQNEARTILQFASTSIESHDRGRASSYLTSIPQYLRGWEWKYLFRLAYYSPHHRIVTDAFIKKMAVVPKKNQLVTVSETGQLDRWDLKTFGRIATLQLPNPSPNTSFHFSEDVAEVAYVIFGDEKRIDVVSVETGTHVESVATWEKLRPRFKIALPTEYTISNDGRWRVDPHHNLSVSDLLAEKPRFVWGDLGADGALFTPNSTSLLVYRNQGEILGNRMLPPDHQASSKWTLYKADTGQVEATWEGGYAMDDFAFIESGARIVASDSVYSREVQYTRKPSGLSIWDLAAIPTSRVLRSSNKMLNNLSISSDSQFIAAGCSDGHVYVWRIATGELVGDLTCYEERAVTFHPNQDFSSAETPSVAFCPEGNWLAVDHREPYSDGIRPAISLYEVPTLKIKWTTAPAPKNHRASRLWYSNLAWKSPDELLAYNRNAEGFYGSLHSVEDGRELQTAHWGAHNGLLSYYPGNSEIEFNGISFTPSGTAYAAYSWFEADRMAMVVVDLKAGRRLFAFRDKKDLVAGSAVFNLAGTQLALTQHSKINLLNAANGNVQQQLEASSSRVISQAFHPDGSRLATGCADGSIHLFDTRTGSLMLTMRGHTSAVLDCSFTPDGSRLISTSLDGTARIWESILPGDFIGSILDR